MASEKATAAKKNLEVYAHIVNQSLSNYFNQERLRVFGVSAKEKKLSAHILAHVAEHALRPAKRLRSAFVYYGYQLFRDDHHEEIIQASLSVELIHTGLLIHDDFMDQDDMRRGSPTTHKYYYDIHTARKYSGNGMHYGASMAVNIGDYALFLGQDILGRSQFPAERKIEALNRLSRGIVNTAIGQAFDVTIEAKRDATEKDVKDLHFAKTAIYTYENPLHVGAILAGAKQKDLEILSKYAVPAGIAFQIQDDILGLFGDTKKTGKPAFSDLREGKVTLLVINALENATSKEVSRLRTLWGKADITNDDANEAREIVIRSGSLDYSRKLAIKMAKRAQIAIPLMKHKGWNADAIDYLDGIAQYMIEREY